MRKHLGIAALQARQLTRVDHVKSHLLQTPLEPSQGQKSRAGEVDHLSEHPHFAHGARAAATQAFEASPSILEQTLQNAPR